MKLSFYGGVEGVTGSCSLLELQDATFVIDCGFFQGEQFCSTSNYDEFTFDPTLVDAVFLTHAHYDHTGRIPLMVKQGYRGPFFCTPPTLSLVKLILEDAYHLMVTESRECGREPLYEHKDLEQAFSQLTAMNYHTAFSPKGRTQVMFWNAGHILGSAFISMDVPGSGRIVFSGDLGNDDVPILPSTEPIHRADYIVTETTYGDRDHEPSANREDALKTFLSEILGNGGTVLIPAFSIERTQELLYALDHLVDMGEIPDVPIYLDSPLAIKATEVYRHFKHYLEFDRPILESPDHDFFSFKGLKETLTVDQSKSINENEGAKIIIAGSGMMNGGRILHHLKRYLHNPTAGVLIIGYQAEGTLGRKIQDGAKEVIVDGETIAVKARITSLDSFSAHADRGKIRRWLKPEEGGVKRIFLVHGENNAKDAFRTFLGEHFEANIEIPDQGASFDL